MNTPADAPLPTVRAVISFQRVFLRNLATLQGKDLSRATPNDCYLALAYTVRERLVERRLATARAHAAADTKSVCYLSAEYLLGRQLGNNLLSLGVTEVARRALAELGLDLATLAALESEPGLGNGGLGRLAACFLDSLATLRIPAIGYGIRYEYGIFRQSFQDGWQVEQPDDWLRWGDPWEFPDPDRAVEIRFGGRTERRTDERGRIHTSWIADRSVIGIPYDLLIPGYRSGTVNALRLWSARAAQPLDLSSFNAGDYARASAQREASENITRVLYPDDTTPQGKRLRLEQQYFFVACSLADILRDLHPEDDGWEHLPERVAIQLNDTHPSIGIVELMRLLVDEHGLEWEQAWEITRRTFAYTVHTLMPEALETWPVGLLGGLLPRHLEIIYELNRRFLDEIHARFPGDEARIARMAIVAGEGEWHVRMAHLACVGSYAVNGVAGLHSQLLKENTLVDFAALWPEKFTTVTNAVTPRRFVALANPRLAALITGRIGDGWLRDLDRLRRLEGAVDDPDFRAAWRAVKRRNKEDLAAHIGAQTGIAVDASSLFDMMVKRLHEYKRQLLKALHIIALYRRIKEDPGTELLPRTVIFGAKAAPGYRMAKLIIKFVNAIAAVVNADPDVRGRLAVVFLPNFNVSLAERIYPAADLSEQISLAGKEASGTGNMKFALNGALTIGTLDGANIEIRERVGAENFFLFGVTAEEAEARKAAGYSPMQYYNADAELRQAIDAVAAGEFADGDRELFAPLVDALLYDDPYMVCADFRSYVERQDAVERAYADGDGWTRMSILNSARCGFFSSDRAIRQYSAAIWRVAPVTVGRAGRP